MSGKPSIHASCVIVGEAGVLIRGPSGSGKSSLGAALVERAAGQGLFARLVADDRVLIAARNGRLVASTPAAIAGLIERRGVGIVPAAHLADAVVRLVVDIELAPERMPEPDERTVTLEGVALPRLAVARDGVELPGSSWPVSNWNAKGLRVTQMLLRSRPDMERCRGRRGKRRLFGPTALGWRAAASDRSATSFARRLHDRPRTRHPRASRL